MKITDELKKLHNENLVETLLFRHVNVSKEDMKRVFGSDFEKRVLPKSSFYYSSFELLFEEEGELYSCSFEIDRSNESFLFFPFNNKMFHPIEKRMIAFYQSLKDELLSSDDQPVPLFERFVTKENATSLIESVLNHKSIRLRALFQV